MRKPTGDQNMKALNLNHGINVTDKFMQIMQTIGMVILLALMVFVFGNDIYKIIFK